MLYIWQKTVTMGSCVVSAKILDKDDSQCALLLALITSLSLIYDVRFPSLRTYPRYLIKGGHNWPLVPSLRPTLYLIIDVRVSVPLWSMPDKIWSWWTLIPDMRPTVRWFPLCVLCLIRVGHNRFFFFCVCALTRPVWALFLMWDCPSLLSAP